MPRTETKPYYRVLVKTKDGEVVKYDRSFYVGKLAHHWAECWPDYNVYVFERGKLIRTIPYRCN